jgi:CRP-like cAMP-binding protein
MLRNHSRSSLENFRLIHQAGSRGASIVMVCFPLLFYRVTGRMGVRKQYANSILQQFSQNFLTSVSSELTTVELSRGTVLFKADTAPTHVYFPIDSVISFLGDTGEGSSIEVWSVGNEGLAGISGLLGGTKPFRGVVQISGKAVMANAGSLRRHLLRDLVFNSVVLSYYEYLLVQVAYIGTCNSHHPIEQRLCRWLLMIRDRAGDSELRFTHDAIASILGTRRATISVAAANLQQARLIDYTPGMITIRSLKGLQKAACRCYHLIQSRRFTTRAS